jgi:transcriptional regulator with XRE-family HTH domain
MKSETLKTSELHFVYTNVQMIRTLKGESQENIAAALSMTRANYCKLENGKVKMTVELLEKIANYLKVSFKYIVNFENPYEEKE